MNTSMLAMAALGAVAAGGVAYVFLYPILSGEKRVEKRHRAVAAPHAAKNARVERVTSAARREQVSQSLKDLDQREKARNEVTLEMRITQAGLDWSKRSFYLASAAGGALLALAFLVLAGSPLMAVAGLFIGGLGLPRWVLRFLKKRRTERYLNELPNAIDVIIRGLRSGLPLNDCLRIISRETAEPVRSEFRFLVEQQSLGIPIAEAVMKLYQRVPVPEANFLAIVIGIQSKAGGNLSEALGNLSRVLRERKKMKGKIQAMSMEAKASAGIIAALPFIVAILTYLSSPAYIELLFITLTGKVMLAISAVWMTVGCLVMKKMINFDF